MEQTEREWTAERPEPLSVRRERIAHDRRSTWLREPLWKKPRIIKTEEAPT
jgi:hypothetical protein